MSDDLHFKKSKGASQSQCLVLTEDNFLNKTKSRWNLISQRDVAAWASDGMTALEGFVFEIFVYVQRRTGENVPSGLRRATAGRIEASARQIRQHEDRTNVRIGPITRQHVAMHQARQPEGTDFVLPSDNTTRQAQYLDQRREEAARDERGGGDENQREDRTSKKIKIEINGCWVEVKVDVNSLRAALGLPQHDLFSEGMFRDCVHNETIGPDVEDTDHGAIQPPPPSPVPPSLPLTPIQAPTADNDETDSNADSQVQAI